MATANDVLRIASAEIGYHRYNDPLNGTKYGRWYAGITNSPYFGTNGVPYCAMFVAWVLDKAGQKCPGMPTASVYTALAGGRNAGIVLANKRDARPGDLVIFDWYADQDVDHIGFVEINCGSYIQTIEGNTSSGSSGSQGDGGGVYRRTRDWSVVYAVIRPPYSGAPSGGGQITGIDVDGFWGSGTTRRAQEVAGLVADGEVWGQNPDHRGAMPACTSGWCFDTCEGSPLIRFLQGRWGVEQDGVMGPDTINAMISYYMERGSGAYILDGRLDAESLTVKAFQRELNAGRI